MVEFNADGSLKLPDRFHKAKQDEQDRFLNTACLRITKEVVSDRSPKKCQLTVELSPKMWKNDFVHNIYRFFSWQAETPTKFHQVDNKKFTIEIGSAFRRCTECTSLIGRYREFQEGNLQIKKGNCPYDPQRNFSFDDYFD